MSDAECEALTIALLATVLVERGRRQALFALDGRQFSRLHLVTGSARPFLVGKTCARAFEEHVYPMIRHASILTAEDDRVPLL